MYKKRAGTSGIQGQLYETKLLSLIYFRMIHNDNIDQFSLSTNRDDVGAFDDICFKAKLKEFDKSVTVFIQAKHRENDKLLTLTSKTELVKYFDSYLEIRRAFDPSSEDMIFGGKLDETECFYVMYTTAKDEPHNKTYDGRFADNLNEIIGTGGCCTQPSYRDEDLDILCKVVMNEEITTLAKQLAKFICDKSKSEFLMKNDLMLRYHVILALNVLDVSDIQPEGHRVASFRQDFFATNDEYLVLFKNILCLEVLKKRKSEEIDVQNLLLKFLGELSETTTLSKLLGSVLTYKNGKLEFATKALTTDDQKRQLDKANVPQSTIYGAAELAAKEYLLSLKLKVPNLFGNKDLAIRGNPKKIENRLNYLTVELKRTLKDSKPNNIVTIDESMGDGFLQLNGGIASAVGNIIVFDETSKLLKFTDNCETLGKLAKAWYETLKGEIENLHQYKFDVKVSNFPKLLFERGKYDAELVKDFYDKLLFYTNQADQNGVEEILRCEIEDHPCNDVNKFRVRSDVIFLKYHNEIQKLWMTPRMGSYLTKESKIYENAVTNALSEPFMGVLNVMHETKNKHYTFNEDAMKRFALHGQIVGTTICSETFWFTVAKVEQYLRNKDYIVLDLEYIIKLPLKSHNTLCKELMNTTKNKILVIACNTFQDCTGSGKRLENIANAVDGKQIIVITDKIFVDIMTKYFSQASNVLDDERSVFTDLSVESQKQIVMSYKIKLQGADVSLDLVVDDEFASLIEEDVFNKIIDNETVDIGDMGIYKYNYLEEEFYIVRRISRMKNQEHDKFDDVKDKVLETLYDLEDDVVLITAEPGMGKSNLLTHLSRKTKQVDPKVWIVRINLAEHGSQFGTFSKLDDENAFFDTLESLKFLCQVAVGKEYEKQIINRWIGMDEAKYLNSYSSFSMKDKCKYKYVDMKIIIELEESSNGIISLRKWAGAKSTVFQLKVFLHYYNRGKCIFLFDGFDEILPKYERSVLSLMKLVRSHPGKHKVWITSRPFNIVTTSSTSSPPYILDKEFGPPYGIENFSRLEQDTHLNTQWKVKIKFRNLNRRFLKVEDFIDIIDKKFIQQDHFFRGYVLFLEFLNRESTAIGLEFDYDEHYNRFMARFGLSENDISCFPDYTMPWHLTALAESFDDRFERGMSAESFMRNLSFHWKEVHNKFGYIKRYYLQRQFHKDFVSYRKDSAT